MHIAVVHSYYRSATPSGENLVVDEQVRILRESGHEVTLVAQESDARAWSTVEQLTTGIKVMARRGVDPLGPLEDARPDIVHVHNLFPNFGYDWLRDWEGPVVTTLHNFRSVCANGLLFRDGQACFDCPTGRPFAAIQHRCYHDSRAATIPLAIRNRRGVRGDPLLQRAQAVILLSRRAADTMRAFGLSENSCRVIPNGVALPARHNRPDEATTGSLFVGRLSAEKGILELVREWPADEPLDVIGDGPLEAAAIKLARGKPIRFLGRLAREDILDKLPGYEALVMPSRCLEMQPTSVVEALGSGVPVLAWAGTSAASIVTEGSCGATYQDASDLTTGLTQIRDGGEDMRRHAIEAYDAAFTPQVWVRRIVETYETAATRWRSGGRATLGGPSLS